MSEIKYEGARKDYETALIKGAQHQHEKILIALLNKVQELQYLDETGEDKNLYANDWIWAQMEVIEEVVIPLIAGLEVGNGHSVN